MRPPVRPDTGVRNLSGHPVPILRQPKEAAGSRTVPETEPVPPDGEAGIPERGVCNRLVTGIHTPPLPNEVRREPLAAERKAPQSAARESSFPTDAAKRRHEGAKEAPLRTSPPFFAIFNPELQKES